MAGERAAVEDPVRVGAEQRGERRREQRPVEPEMDAHDRRVLERRRGFAEQARALARRHGEHDRVGVEVVERLHAIIEPHPVAEHAPGGVAVHPPERLLRQDEVGVPARAEERRANGEEPGPGVDLVGTEVERGADEDVPEALDGRIARAEPPEHRAERLAGPRLRVAAPRRDDRDADTVAQRHVRVRERAPAGWA